MMDKDKRILVGPENKELTEKLRKAFLNTPGVISVVDDIIVKELKHKKDIPTVIEYQGRRYVLDHANNRK